MGSLLELQPKNLVEVKFPVFQLESKIDNSKSSVSFCVLDHKKQ